MKQAEIGKFIKKLRKDKNLSQTTLANILGVSPKTISKWECGNGLPDTTILDKLSKSLDLSIDELLTCKKQENKQNHKISYKIIFIIIIVILIPLIIIIKSKNNPLENQNSTCILIKTYHIDNIGNSNDENYQYLTIHEFQTEGIYTIKLPIIIAKELEIAKNYEFTIETKKELLNKEPDILFNNSNILNVKHTTKTGLEVTNTYTCN